MYMCIYMHVYVYMHLYVYMHVYAYTHICCKLVEKGLEEHISDITDATLTSGEKEN